MVLWSLTALSLSRSNCRTEGPPTNSPARGTREADSVGLVPRDSAYLSARLVLPPHSKLPGPSNKQIINTVSYDDLV